MLHNLNKWLVFGAFGLMCSTALAGEVNAAVAANFAEPMQKIAALFEKETGNKVRLSMGATGKFYSQIREGAPFDVLLSADEKTPRLLELERLAVADTDFVYAQGRLVLWSAKPGFVDGKGAVLNTGNYNRIAYADPKLAPYGMAAQQTLQRMSLWDKLQNRMVIGESIGQTYQFAASGNAELAFIALSQISKNGKVTTGSYWVVPASLYNPIKQAAVQLTAAKDKEAARALLSFLKSEKAAAVIRSYGYELP